jgi:hypothetical protein
MNLTIEGESLAHIEDKIIALAADIEDRRTLLRQGCTCDMTKPKTRRTGFGPDGRGSGVVVAVRCHGAFAVCDARKARFPHAA